MAQPLSNINLMKAWNKTPLMTRLTLLARSVVNGERPEVGVGKLIGLVALMASFLGAEQRLLIANQLRDEADALAPPFERRALN
jgi:hypothetical protein